MTHSFWGSFWVVLWCFNGRCSTGTVWFGFGRLGLGLVEWIGAIHGTIWNCRGWVVCYGIVSGLGDRPGGYDRSVMPTVH